MKAVRWLPWLYLSLICTTQELVSGCVDLRDPCYDDCALGPDGDRCRAACDERPEPGGH